MPKSDVLQRITEGAQLLAEQELRSASIIVGHLRGLILQAHGMGHRHKDIHASLQAGGLHATWNTYKSCLMRMKRAAQALPSSSARAAMLIPVTSPTGTATGPMSASTPARPRLNEALEPGASDPIESLGASTSTSSATRVLDALNEARRVASSRDYAQIGRDLYRQQQRDQRNGRSRSIQSVQTKDPS